jgi:branched-chain amino acid transport system ATP-binding protein
VRDPDASDSRNGDELHARGLRIEFEGLVAVDDVNVKLAKGETLGLIGPNGAGKTTLINALTGFVDLNAGEVEVAGTTVTGWPPHRLPDVGLARTFQGARLFTKLTVLENVECALVARGHKRRAAQTRAAELLDMFGLGALRDEPAQILPAGDERRLSVARAVASDPAFLLLDEPGAGLNESESKALIETLRAIRNDLGCGVLLVDHDMRVIMGLCDRIQVLDYGRTIALGDPESVRADPAVIEAYLG